MKILRLACALVLAWATAGAAAQSDSDALVSYLDTLTSFAADFEQRRFDEDGALLEQSTGDCQIKRPGRFRWNYTDPYAQLIVSDGATLWIYDPDLEQATRSTITEFPQDSPAALLGQQTDVATSYAITALPERADGYAWFELVPQAAAADFSAIELGFGDGEVRAMRLTDKLGQVTALSFVNIKRNAAVDDALFAFAPPPGIDVIEGAAP